MNIKKIICITVCVIIILSSYTLSASALIPTNFDIDAEGAMLVNTDTGNIVYSKNVDKRLYPASLTKLMTALILFENTKDIDNEIITVSEYAIKSLQGTDSSVGGLKIGEKLTVRQMLYVLLLSSANDGANAIAEYVSGDVNTFVELMNNKAKELGMINTKYKNAHGLHDPEHYTTVSDMYILTKAFLSVDLLKEISFTTKYKLEATNLSSARNFKTTNFLLLNNGQKCTADKYKGEAYYYKYAKGLKTGYTDNAGRCLISTASKNGYNYLCIIMNSPVYDSKGNKIRLEFGDTKKLYEWAFNELEYKTVLDSGNVIFEVPVELSWDTDYVSAYPSKTISAIIPKIADTSTITTKVHLYKDSYDAPIKKGDVLGECDIIYADEILETVTIVASQNIERSTIMYIARGVKNFFVKVIGSTTFLIIAGLIILAIIIFIIICVIINSPKRKRRRY